MRRLIVCLLILTCCFSFTAFPTEAALSGKQVSPAELTQAAKTYLQTAIPLKDYNLRLKSKLSTQSVPAGKLSLRVKPINPQKWGGHTAVPVEIFVDGKKYRTVVVNFDLQVFQQVAVVTQPLKKGEAFSTENVVLKRMEISRLNQQPYTQVEQLAGARATRYLDSNTILTKNSVEEVPLVLKGKAVTIRAKVGMVEISTVGKALADGRMGNLVQVQNLDSGKKLFAKVVGSALVEIPNKN